MNTVQKNIIEWNIPQPKRKYKVVVHCSTYNHEAYIEQALKGFVTQQTDFPFCVIVIDDASTDKTADIVRKNAEMYPDIIKPILLRENHMQKGKARNPYFDEWHKAAVYLAQCEGDDYWTDPLKLQKQVDYMDTHPECMLCGTNGLILTEKGLKRPAYFNHDFSPREIPLEEIIGHWHFPTCSLLYRREVCGDDYPAWTKKIYSGDQTLTLISGVKGSIYSLGEVTCVYRKMPDNPYSLTNVTAKNHLFEVEEHIKLYTYFRDYAPRKYSDCITAHLEKLKKERRYMKLRQKAVHKPFIVMPAYSIRKLVSRDIPSMIKHAVKKHFHIDILKEGQYN